MLHIKDIEAFARINEALNGLEDGAAATSGTAEDKTAHPALIMAMVATGRLPMSALPKGMTLPPNRLKRP